MRTLDDVYLYLGAIPNIATHRKSLSIIENSIGRFDFRHALTRLSSHRTIPPMPVFRVTVSLAGGCNYNREEVASRVAGELMRQKLGKWNPQPKRGSFPDIDVRIHKQGSKCLVGLRVGTFPLYRRSYKKCHLKGALKSTVAASMLQMASLHAGLSMLDPTCGTGTILAEAAIAHSSNRLIGIDRSQQAINCAKINLEGLAPHVNLSCGDARNLPIPTNTIDRIVANLPWGQQVAKDHDFIQRFLMEIDRVLVSNGIVVLLTPEIDEIKLSLKTALQFRRAYPIRLNGRTVDIIRMEKKS